MNDLKRYNMKINYDYDSPPVKQVEEEFGQWVTYTPCQELLKQFDKLEEAGLGYWLMDEFVLIKDGTL